MLNEWLPTCHYSKVLLEQGLCLYRSLLIEQNPTLLVQICVDFTRDQFHLNCKSHRIKSAAG